MYHRRPAVCSIGLEVLSVLDLLQDLVLVVKLTDKEIHMLINRSFQWGQHPSTVHLQCIHNFLHMVLILEYHILLGQNVFLNLDGRH